MRSTGSEHGDAVPQLELRSVNGGGVLNAIAGNGHIGDSSEVVILSDSEGSALE